MRTRENENEVSAMKTKTMTLSAIKINEKGELGRLFGRLSYGVIYVALAAFLIMLVMFSGVAMGNPQISDTLFEGMSYGDDAESNVTISDEDLVAEAGWEGHAGNSGTIAQWNIQAANNYLGNGWTYRYGGNPYGNLYRYYYWAGNSSSNNYDVWDGGFGVKGGGTVRQKEIVMTAYVRVTLSGVLANLASSGNLYISRASATMKSVNGYDQDMRWWVASGAPAIAGGNSSFHNGPSGGWYIGNRWVTGNNSAGNLSANGWYRISSTTFSICMSARTNYTKWVGGRYPGAQIYDIDLTFNSGDGTGPKVDYANEPSSWAKEREVQLTVTDKESGNDMYTYTSNYPGRKEGTTYYTFSFVKSALTYTFTNRSGKSTSGALSVDRMKIDRNPPTMETPELITSNVITGGVIAADKAYKDVYLRVNVSDNQSGIKSVTVTNTTTGDSIAQSNSSGNVRVFGPLPANGSYQVVATDNVGWPTKKDIDCWCIDKVDPKIEKVIFEYNGISSENLDTFTTSTMYVNAPIKVTFIIKEKADAKYYAAYNNNTYKDLHKLKEFKFTYNNVTPNATEGYEEKYGSISYGTVSYSEEGAWFYRYTYYMPMTGTYRFMVTDKADRYTVTAPCGTELNPYIDTTAPKTTGYSLTPDASKIWTKNEVVLKIDLSDVYKNVMNQGSGLKRIWLFKNGIPSGIDFTTDAAMNHGDYVDHRNLSGDSTSVTFTLNRYDYCDAKTYYWVVVDNAGNTSQMNSETKTYNGTMYTNYYQNDKGSYYVKEDVKRDTRDVKLRVYDSTGNYAYSTSSDSEVRLAWTNEKETVFKFIADFGPSGATFKMAKVSATNSTDAAINEARDLLNSATFNPIATVDLLGANSNTFMDAVGNPANKKENSVAVQYKVAEKGTTLYKFIITNGAGVEYRTGIIIVRRDLDGPTVNLLGFGDYSHDNTVSSDEEIINRIDNFISEETMYGYSSTWYGKPINAIISIKDPASGVLGTPQSYNQSEGVTATVESKAKAKVTFSHNGYTYTVETGYYQAGNGISVLSVPLWNLEDIKKNCPSIYNSSTDTYNIKQGQGEPFVYNIRVADFCGNYSNVNNKGGSANLAYHVDPFELDLEVESIKQVDSNGVVSDYVARPVGDWTRNKVVVTVNKTKLGLSPVWIKYYVKTVAETADGTLTDLINQEPSYDSTAWSSQLVVGDSGGGMQATIEFPATSRFVQLLIMVTNSTKDNVGGPLRAFQPEGSPDDFTEYLMIIRQDTDAPNMNGMGYFFSTNPEINGNPYGSDGKLREDILLYYLTEYDQTTKSYKSIRQTNNRNLVNVWSHAPAYLYIIASDATGSAGYGMGSGIARIEFTAGTRTETLTTETDRVSYTANNYQGIYRSKTAFGYVDIKENYELKIKLVDKQGNNAQYTMSKDTDGHKLLPVIDTEIPMITIDSATYGTPAVSYLKNGKFIGSEENVLKTDLNVHFNMVSGISGATIYVRRRPWQENINGNSPLVINNSVRADGKYGFISLTGIKLNENGELDPAEWEKISGTSYEISSNVPVKNRFDFIVVSGTGVFYYLEAGDVFIDTVPPVIEENLIFYALESSEENLKGQTFDNPINYDKLRLATLSTMTNDNLYAYFRITDINGSGVLDSTVKALEPTAGEILTKVYVYREVNGQYVTEEYYRLKFTETNNYSIEAYDVAGNRVRSKQYKPSIDRNPISLQVGMTDANGANYAFYDGAYTNTEYIKVTLSASYGVSGLGKVMFATSDDGITWTPYQDLSALLTSIGSSAVWQTNDKGSQSTIEFNIYTEQNKYYSFYAENGVKVYKTENGKDVIPHSERGRELDVIKVAIDKTAPVININDSIIKAGDSEIHDGFETLDAGAKLYGTKQWYGTGIVLAVSAKDPNDYGSGISRIRVDHVLDGVSQDTYFFVEKEGYFYAENGDKDFVYDNYADYKITLIDRAGNTNVYTVRPKIDTIVPAITSGVNLVADTDEGTAPYTSDTWTRFDVKALFETMHSISGVTLQYSRSKGSGSYGPWQDSSTSYAFGDFTVADNKKKVYKDTAYRFTPEGSNVSFDHAYKFRLVSGAGLISEEVTVGRIKIDKEKPVINVVVSTVWGPLSRNNLEDLTNTDPNSTIMSGWTQDNITVTVTSDSALVSGFKVVYNVNQGETKWNEAQGTVGNDVSTFQLTSDPKKFIHRITTSKYEENYEYYFESGSGMRSEIYYVKGIKLDKADPDFKIEAETSDEYGEKNADGNKFATTTADKYEQNKLASLDDSQMEEINRILAKKYVYGTFTDRNSVIIKVTISSINYSGVTLAINGYVYETFDYAGYKDKVPLERYYVVSNDYRDVTFTGSDGKTGTYYDSASKMFDLDIKLYSGAGKANDKAAKVAIDNDIPFIYVAGITGTKSTDWDPSNPDNCWYVSSDTAINLKVGTLRRNGENYGFSDRVSDSGYTVYYAYDNGMSPDTWTWIDNNTTSQIKIIGQPIVENQIYRFKIVSKSGMEYILGSSAYDNHGATAVTADGVKSIVEGQGGLVSHLTDVDFGYRMNVDSTEYSLGISQLLPFVVNDRTIVEESLKFADYTIIKTVNVYDKDGNVTGTTDKVMTSDDYIYRHGDRIAVRYAANVSDKYYHRYTDYGISDENGVLIDEKKSTFENADVSNETSGSFNYKFGYGNLKVNAYFIKELSVKYGGTVIYRQSQDKAEVSATTSYTYTGKDSSGTTVQLTVSIGLTVSYADMSGNLVPAENMALGGYLVNTVVNGSNANSFRLTNPQTVLLVKYFDETVEDGVEVPNGVDNPYSINDAKDLNYVSATYYKDFGGSTGSFVLGTPYKYYDNAFELKNNVELGAEFGGIEVFNGSLNGKNNVISLYGGDVNGSYGLFGTLGGTVKNLIVSVNNEIVVTDGTDVGVLASVIENGKVSNVRVSANMRIKSLSSDASVGGLAGKATGASVIGDRDGKVFADVTIANKGSRLTGGNIGGLIGYLGGESTVRYSYTYSHITVYNVSASVNAGAVIGDAEKKNFVSDEVYDVYSNNAYVENNVFVNDEVKTGFIGTASNAESKEGTIKAVGHDSFVGVTSDATGSYTVAGERIRDFVLRKLYVDFGADIGANGEFENGLGTAASPFVVTTQRQLRAIDGYVNLYYELSEDVDMTGFGEAIGLHKVFGGKFDGKGRKLDSFDGADISDGDVLGLFAAVSGTVTNVVMPTVEISAETGSGTVYGGVIAGKLLGGVISNVIIIGTFNVTGGVVYAGGVAGISVGGEIYDAFSIVNVKVIADEKATVGGIAGRSDNTKMGGTVKVQTGSQEIEYTKAIYALGRVEAESISAEIGAIAATGTLADGSSDVYAVKDNAYSNGQITNHSISGAINMVTFDDDGMRNTTFSDGTNAFNKVFVSDKLYYLEGLGRSIDKFKVTTAEEFRKIEHMLYAHYNIVNDISFSDADPNTSFRTIGYGLKFTGSVDGKNKSSWSAEEGTLSSLMNVTDALVYDNAGSITDLGVNVYYNRTVLSGETLTFGSIAVINSTGTLRNVTVSGEIDIVGADKYDTTVIVSGFVGQGLGGIFESDSKVQNSISGLAITVNNVGTVYAGGYVGKVDGLMTLSYGIGNGTMDVNGCGTVYAGTIVGAAYRENEWTSLEETKEYRYIVTVDGVIIEDLFGIKVYE